MLKTVFNPEFAHLFERSSTCNFESIWNSEPIQIFTAQRTSDVRIVQIPGAAEHDHRAVLKRYWYPRLSDRLKGFFRNTFFGMCRAAREFRSLTRLGSVGCSLVRPIAIGEARTLRLLERSFILTEYLPGTKTLEDVLLSRSFRTWPFARRRKLAADLGCWVRAIHDRRFHDRDFFARNILVHRSPPRTGRSRTETSRFLFSKIDSSAATGGKAQPGAGRPFLRDLIDLDRDVGMGASRTDRLRFLLAYMATFRMNAEVRVLAAHIGKDAT